MKSELKKRLHMLLSIKAANKGLQIREIDNFIASTKIEMQQEDVAWVEKNIAELYTDK